MSYVPTFTINTSTKPEQILRSPIDSMGYGKWSIPEPIFVSQRWHTKNTKKLMTTNSGKLGPSVSGSSEGVSKSWVLILIGFMYSLVLLGTVAFGHTISFKGFEGIFENM